LESLDKTLLTLTLLTALIAITLNKAFRRSEKIYGATAAAVAYPIAAAHLEQALQDVRDAWNKEAVSKALFVKNTMFQLLQRLRRTWFCIKLTLH
jgi:hypothetical protein